MPLQNLKPVGVAEHIALCPLTSFKIGGEARFFARPHDATELGESLQFAREEQLPVFVLGGGCNVLVADGGFNGLVISLSEMKYPEANHEGECITVPANLSLPMFGKLLRHNNLSGLEFLSQIPGTVGGAVVMNAGFSRSGDRAQAIGRRVARVFAIDFDGKKRTFEESELQFSYRHSNLSRCIIHSVMFRLRHEEEKRIAEEMEKNYIYRMSVQDLRFPSAGSVFKNPAAAHLTIGQMIDTLGLKGTRAGGAEISEIHGNFIINKDHACSRDVCTLIRLIRKKVKQHFGVVPELEIRLLGINEHDL